MMRFRARRATHKILKYVVGGADEYNLLSISLEEMRRYDSLRMGAKAAADSELLRVGNVKRRNYQSIPHLKCPRASAQWSMGKPSFERSKDTTIS